MKLELCALLLFLGVVCPSKILFLIPMATRSEKHFFSPLIDALASQGHELTVVTNVKSSVTHQNISELVPVSVSDVFGSVSNVSDLPARWEFIFVNMNQYVGVVEKIFNNSDFKLILDKEFDLVFTNVMYHQFFYGAIARVQAPFILLSSFPVQNYFIQGLGLYSAPSVVPHSTLSFTDRMTFGERLVNFAVDWATYFINRWKWMPMIEGLYRKHFGQHLPSVEEMDGNVSLLMTNTHFTSTYHRSQSSQLIEIGGLHCIEPKPLPEDLEAFVKGSGDEGFIFLSFGTLVAGSTLPLQIRDKFVRVFSRIKSRVIWKWDEERIEGLSENVLLKNWLPQQDILGHPKLRLFISHGGLLSTQQMIFHAAPSILFPFFFDQFTNAKYAEQQGFGIKMDIWNFSEEELEANIRAILEQLKYKQTVNHLSSVFKSQMNTPMERALWWTNHVLEFKGAPHLRSPAPELHFTQYHSLDVILFLGAVISFILTLFFIIIRKLISCISQKLGRIGKKQKQS